MALNSLPETPTEIGPPPMQIASAIMTANDNWPHAIRNALDHRPRCPATALLVMWAGRDPLRCALTALMIQRRLRLGDAPSAVHSNSDVEAERVVSTWRKHLSPAAYLTAADNLVLTVLDWTDAHISASTTNLPLTEI